MSNIEMSPELSPHTRYRLVLPDKRTALALSVLKTSPVAHAFALGLRDMAETVSVVDLMTMSNRVALSGECSLLRQVVRKRYVYMVELDLPAVLVVIMADSQDAVRAIKGHLAMRPGSMYGSFAVIASVQKIDTAFPPKSFMREKLGTLHELLLSRTGLPVQTGVILEHVVRIVNSLTIALDERIACANTVIDAAFDDVTVQTALKAKAKQQIDWYNQPLDTCDGL